MIRIQNIPLPIGGGEEQLRKRAARLLGLNPGQLRSLTLARQSIDARKKSDVHYVCTVHVEVDNEARIMARCRDKNVSLHAERPYAFPPVRRTSPLPPVVVGMGPSGLFAALFLARNGVIPIVLERGRPVEERTADVERFWATGVLDTTSNVQFGEGGAGTFSDGKLTTGTHDPRISTVFRALVEAGAPADILYQHKPHIGTDILRDVVRNVRRELLALGCDVRFGHRLAGLDVRDGALRAVAVDGPGGRYDLPCDALVLSPGHSARDTFQMLLDAGVPMAPKPFAIGVRIEHAQAALSEAGFGDCDLQIGRLVIGRDFDDLPRILQCDIVDGRIKLEIGRRGDFPDFIACQRQGFGGRNTPGIGSDIVHHPAAALIDDFIDCSLEGSPGRNACDGVCFGGVFVDLNLTCDGFVDPLNFRRAARTHIDGLIFLIQDVALGRLQLSQIKASAGIGTIREIISGDINIAVIVAGELTDGIAVLVVE